MHLHELFGWPGPLTHRQFLAWSEWIKLEWNRPDRHDNYTMQVAAEVRRGNAKNPRSVKNEHFKIPFEFKAMPEGRMSTEAPTAMATNHDGDYEAEDREQAERERLSKIAKAHHLAILGGKVRRVKRSENSERN